MVSEVGAMKQAAGRARATSVGGQKRLCIDPQLCRHGSEGIVPSGDLKLAANFE
jgi:hypothetical protein